MLISHSKEFILLEIPRTASRSLRFTLVPIAGPSYQEMKRHYMVIPKDCAHYYTFVCVRNPYSREVSHYLYRLTNKKNNMFQYVSEWSFEEYVKWATNPVAPPVETHDKPQNVHLAGKRIDRLLYIENLLEGFYQLPFVDPGIRLQKVGINPRYDWRSFYTQEIADMVYDWSKSDFELYGYDPDSWKAP